MKRYWLGLVLPLLAAVPSAAQEQASPPPVPAVQAAPAGPNAPAGPAGQPAIEVTEALDLTEDRTQRMTVPVSINGRGPYGFIIDTGAERTVISRELAERLGLGPGRSATLFSMTEASEIQTVVIPALDVGRRTVNDIHAPALERRHLGAEGLLGVDSLRSQRVTLDFVRNEMTVTSSRREQRRWPRDTITVTARNRYGHLMLVDASFDGQRVYVIVDTGSQVTVGNNALRRALERRGRLGPLQPVELVSVTGNAIMAEYGIARQLRIGDAGVTNLPVAFAEVHPFQHLDLTDHPAIMLGMDALQLFDRVSFDFANRRVRFLVPREGGAHPPARMAQARPVSPLERRAAP